MPIDRTCGYCGKIFKAKVRRSSHEPGKFCSKKCTYASKQVEMTCLKCGKVYTIAKSRVKEGRGVFCSKACYLKHQQKNIQIVRCPVCNKEIKAYLNQRRKYCSTECKRQHLSIEKKCPVCNKEFWVPRSVSQQGFGIFCGRECWHKSQHLTLICSYCGKSYDITKGRARRGRKFCSFKCMEKGRIIWNKGKRYSLPKARQTRAERGECKQLNCVWCKQPFYAQTNRIKTGQKCCSREHQRLYETQRNTLNISCRGCGKQFRVKLRKDSKPGTIRTYRSFCSNECRKNNYNAADGFCEMCGKKMKIHRFKIKFKKHAFCSRSCADKGLSLEASIYKHNGKWHNSIGQQMKATKDFYPETKSQKRHRKYRPEHRIMIEKYIGRKLRYNDEPVYHINGIPDDNRLHNLYVCTDRGRMTCIVMGSIPAPTKSNLDILKQEQLDLL